jgi:AraC-like DNA-binding protein
VRGQFKVFQSTVDGILAMQAQSAHAFPRHSHEQFGVGLMMRGAQRSFSGRGMVEADAGDLITVNPGEVHDGAPIGTTERTWQMLYLDPTVVASAGEATESSEFARPALRDVPLAHVFRKLFSSVTICAGEPQSGQLKHDELMTVLLSNLLGDGAVNTKPAVPSRIRAARELLDDEPESPTTLGELALLAGLSRFQTIRAFAQAFGLTPHAYLMQRRVDLARAMIARGTNLADTAVACGFSDQSHMTRVFVKRFGLTPKVFALS